MAYYSTKGKYNGGRPELRPSKITNPNDTKGAGCKHVLNVLGNLDWAMKLATSINNYISYIKDKYPDKYEQIIYPMIFTKPFEPDIEEVEIEEPIEETEIEEVDEE